MAIHAVKFSDGPKAAIAQFCVRIPQPVVQRHMDWKYGKKMLMTLSVALISLEIPTNE